MNYVHICIFLKLSSEYFVETPGAFFSRVSLIQFCTFRFIFGANQGVNSAA